MRAVIGKEYLEHQIGYWISIFFEKPVIGLVLDNINFRFLVPNFLQIRLYSNKDRFVHQVASYKEVEKLTDQTNKSQVIVEPGDGAGSVASCHPQLYRFLLRRLKNHSDAQDLAQEAYLRLLRVEDPELIRQPAAYLFRIAANLVHEFRLKERRSGIIVSLEVVAEPGSYEAPEKRIEQKEILDKIQVVLNDMPPLYAAAFVLCKRDGLSHQEIADKLGISLHTVRKYLTRAVTLCRLGVAKNGER